MDNTEDSDELVKLLGETADGFGRLMADHLKLARLELSADMKTLGRRTAMLAVSSVFVLFGYALCCLGLAVVTSQWLGLGSSLLLLGSAHLVLGVVALLLVMRRLRLMHWMRETTYEANRSLSTLTTRIRNGTAATPERPAIGAQASATSTKGGSPIARNPH